MDSAVGFGRCLVRTRGNPFFMLLKEREKKENKKKHCPFLIPALFRGRGRGSLASQIITVVQSFRVSILNLFAHHDGRDTASHDSRGHPVFCVKVFESGPSCEECSSPGGAGGVWYLRSQGRWRRKAGGRPSAPGDAAVLVTGSRGRCWCVHRRRKKYCGRLYPVVVAFFFPDC